MGIIQQNFLSLQQKIREYEIRYHREPNSVKLLAASKKQSIEKMQQLLLAGQTAFGESYLQEALAKIQFFSQEKIEWHFIGPLQRNKTKKIAEHFHWVHSVDTIDIAKRLNDQRPSHLPPLNICLQINISQEATKSGIPPDEAFFLAQECRLLPNLLLRGLMTIPAPTSDFSKQRSPLHLLKLIYDQMKSKGLEFDTLSMGMSDDLEAAIAEGSTLVRIGTILFGPRI